MRLALLAPKIRRKKFDDTRKTPKLVSTALLGRAERGFLVFNFGRGVRIARSW